MINEDVDLRRGVLRYFPYFSCYFLAIFRFALLSHDWAAL